MKFIEISPNSHLPGPIIVDDADFDWLAQYQWTAYLSGYVVKSSDHRGKIDRMHQMIMGVPPDGCVIDHKNGNKMDNRRENLRFCTPVENRRNSRKPQNAKTSKYKGVSWDKSCNKFQSTIKYGGRLRKIAACRSEVSAAITYNIMACLLFGEFSRLNIIGQSDGF